MDTPPVGGITARPTPRYSSKRIEEFSAECTAHTTPPLVPVVDVSPEAEPEHAAMKAVVKSVDVVLSRLSATLKVFPPCCAPLEVYELARADSPKATHAAGSAALVGRGANAAVIVKPAGVLWARSFLN